MKQSKIELDYSQFVEMCEYYEKELEERRIWWTKEAYDETYREYCQAVHNYNLSADFKEPMPVLLSSDGYPMIDLNVSIMTDRY